MGPRIAWEATLQLLSQSALPFAQRDTLHWNQSPQEGWLPRDRLDRAPASIALVEVLGRDTGADFSSQPFYPNSFDVVHIMCFPSGGIPHPAPPYESRYSVQPDKIVTFPHLSASQDPFPSSRSHRMRQPAESYYTLTFLLCFKYTAQCTRRMSTQIPNPKW